MAKVAKYRKNISITGQKAEIGIHKFQTVKHEK